MLNIKSRRTNIPVSFYCISIKLNNKQFRNGGTHDHPPLPPDPHYYSSQVPHRLQIVSDVPTTRIS